MIRGVRRPEEVQGMGIGRRLMIRVGALLKKSVEITPTVLESARPDTPYEALLLDNALLDHGANIATDNLRALAVKHLGEEQANQESLIVHEAGEGVYVICFEEEVDAEDGWGAESESPAPPTQEPAPSTDNSGSALATVATAHLPEQGARRGSARDHNPAGDALFTPLEIDRQKLRLLTSADADERIEALRILAHAPISASDKAELIFRALDDRNAQVRGEAAELLGVLGVSDDVAESLFTLTEGDPADRLRAAERLTKNLARSSSDLERVAATLCALAALRSEKPSLYAARLIEILEHGGPALTADPHRLAEMVRAVLKQWSAAGAAGTPLPGSAEMYSPMQRLFRKLCTAAPDVVMPVLREEREKATDGAVEAFLLQMLLDAMPADSPQETEMLGACAAFLARDTREGRDSRAVGMTMVPRGEVALLELIKVYPKATTSAQKYFLRLFDDIVRYQTASPEAKNRAVEVVLQAVDGSNRSMRMAAMSCRFVIDPEISEELREKVAEAFLQSITDFGFPQDIDSTEDTISMLGLPAVKPLTKRLAPERNNKQRTQAVRILGRLGLLIKPPKGDMTRTRNEVTSLIRRLQALNAEADFPGRADLYTALGKLAASPAASKQAGTIVARTLLQAVKVNIEKPSLDALEGLTWLASARRAEPELVTTVTGLLKRLMDQVDIEIQSELHEEKGEIVIEIKGEGDLVDMLPVALAGISRILRSRSCPPAVVKDMLKLLCARYKSVSTGRLVWGPGNSMLLSRALQEIGCYEGLPDELRMEILKTLAPNMIQPTALQAIGKILEKSDTAATRAAALTLGLAILERKKSAGKFEEEDRADILRSLSYIAARKHLGAPDAIRQEKAARFRETVIDDLFSGVHDLVQGAFDGLKRVHEAGVLDNATQTMLDRRMKELTSIRLA